MSVMRSLPLASERSGPGAQSGFPLRQYLELRLAPVGVLVVTIAAERVGELDRDLPDVIDRHLRIPPVRLLLLGTEPRGNRLEYGGRRTFGGEVGRVLL